MQEKKISSLRGAAYWRAVLQLNSWTALQVNFLENVAFGDNAALQKSPIDILFLYIIFFI